jgi:tRNA-uridine 2-sulfurtransferase
MRKAGFSRASSKASTMTIAIAMSGGVDSSTAAALLAENNPEIRGPSVVGMTMQLWNQRRLPSLLDGEVQLFEGRAAGRCCSLDDVYDARRVADFLGFPYYVLNFEARFEETVVKPFVESYLRGETPIPCSLCNTEIKFADFIASARQIGAEKVATGHYARVEFDPRSGRYRLLAGRDRSKDQSYFLFGLTQEQLSRTLFPLGDLMKEEVRAIARRKSLPVAEKPESQEICFVPTGDYRRFIEAYLEEQGGKIKSQAGELVSTDGRVIGEHQGVHHFTVGQRKGLGVSVGKPLYVVGIDELRNRVVVGANDELLRRRMTVRDMNWIRDVPAGEVLEVKVKIRNRHDAATARIAAEENSRAQVEFAEPQRAVTPGQAAVFYDGDEVVGGGWIDRAID